MELSTDKFARDIQKEGMFTGKQQEALFDMDKTLSSNNRVDEYFQDAKTGQLLGRLQSMEQIVGRADPEFTGLKLEVDNLLATYTKFISGATVTEQERAFFRQMLPSYKDHPKTFKDKMDAFNRITADNREDFLNSIKLSQPLKASTIDAIRKEASAFATPEQSSADKINSMDEEKRKRYEAFKARRK